MLPRAQPLAPAETHSHFSELMDVHILAAAIASWGPQLMHAMTALAWLLQTRRVQNRQPHLCSRDQAGEMWGFPENDALLPQVFLRNV